GFAALRGLAGSGGEPGGDGIVVGGFGGGAGRDEARAPGAAAAAARAAGGHELLAAERQTALSAVPRLDVNVDFVDEHLLDWENADDPAFRAVILEADASGDLREDRVVLAEPGVQAGAEAAAALSHDDRPAGHP